MLKEFLDLLEINILNIEYCRVHQEWRHQNVNSLYSRLYLITEGQGYVTHHNQSFELKPENMYLIPNFSLADLYCQNSFTHYYIHFTTRLPNGLDLLKMLECSYQIPAKPYNVKKEIFDRLVELHPHRELIERDANKPIYSSVLDRCIKLDRQRRIAEIMESNALMRLLLAEFMATVKPASINKAISGLNRFKPVLDHINDNLADSISLETLAGVAGLHPTYFSNLFKKLMGQSPVQYLNNKRIEKAQHLLVSTNKTLTQIASETGFTDVFYFSRIFKKIAGTSPTGYRNQMLFA